eukprot:TRINITY_DN349_c0_g1_i5.p3 TRINITY_DN349_c0_g1~~TRINITY_DN349_c0_g1_i5.p3  ORF type:complete len:104 (-),score=12.97 TRINITY_DN349_c0_g1_i5:176-487(-)
MAYHTILLVQFNQEITTKTYMDFERVGEAFECLCDLYQQYKRKSDSSSGGVIQYDLTEVFNYIDHLVDLAILVQNPSSNTYTPHGRDWIKAKMFDYMRKQASN